MRYELYEITAGFYNFICESDDFSEIIEKAEDGSILIDNEKFTVNCNLPDFPCYSNEKLKDLIFACKLAKACDDIEDISDDFCNIIKQKENATQTECELFFANMK